ncbi:MAG TPA: glycosyltransferase [Bacillota bacterium]|nr:glycosyltransferase [Bacillota bacterium]
MRISIVIPAFNEERLIGESLRRVQGALKAFAQRGWETEVVVCDNNSTDRTAELARAGGARVVFEPINQIGRARNCGAQTATGDWLVFVDADSYPSRELFAEVAEQIESGRCLAGGSTIELDGDYLLGRIVAGLWNRASRAFRLLAGSFIFCERTVFLEAGGFSQELFAGEELELRNRLKRLARQRKQQIVILHRHPLVTSARKVYLYRKREYLRFFTQVVLGRGKALTSREACQPWYDGRR